MPDPTPLPATAPPALPDAHRWICPECGESPTVDARWRLTGGGPPEHHHGYPVGHIPAEPAVTVYLLPLELGDGQHTTVVTDPQTVADAVKAWCEEGMWGEECPPIKCERWPQSKLDTLGEI